MNTTPKAFITYSHKNTAKRAQFETALAVMISNGEIEIWCDAEIVAGDKWEPEIAKKLKESNILLYLVSADSLASKNCNKELSNILSQESNIRIIPIILEHCDFQHHYLLAGLEVLPEKNKAISRWRNHNEAWQNVVEGIRRIIASPSGKPPQSGQDTPPSTPKGPQSAFLNREQAATWLFHRANFFFMLNNNDLAIADYTKAIEINPNYAMYNNRGSAYGKKGDNDFAIADFNEAVALNPNYVEAYSNRGIVYVEKGDNNRAIIDYNRAIKLNPNDAAVYSNRGVIHGKKGDNALAIADFNEAIELNPNNAASYINRGVIHGKKGDSALAIADLDTAITLNPNDATAYVNRGNVYDIKGDHDTAIANYNKAIALNSNDAEAYASRGMTKKETLKDYKGARADFQCALHLAKQRGDKPLADNIQEVIDELPADSDS